MNKGGSLVVVGITVSASLGGLATFFSARHFHGAPVISCGIGLFLAIVVFIIYIAVLAKIGK